MDSNKEIMNFNRLTRWVVLLIIADTLMSLIMAVFGFFEYQLLSEWLYDSSIPSMYEEFAERQMVIGIIALVISITLSITALRWIYRANLNAQKQSVAELEFTPGWAVGYYFIPIMNLFKPYRAMKEICNISANGRPYKQFLLPLWWFFWITASILNSVSMQVTMKAEAIESYIIASELDIISYVWLVPLNLVFLFLIREVARLQDNKNVSILIN